MVKSAESEDYNVSVSEDCIISVWSLSEPNNLLVYKSQTGVPKQLAINMMLGILVYSSAQEYPLNVINLNSSQVVIRLQGHSGLCTGINISESRKMIMSAAEDGTVRLWNIKSGNCLHVLAIDQPILMAQLISNDSRLLFIDKHLKVRAKNFFVSSVYNGSAFESLTKSCEILSNFNFLNQRKIKYKESFEKLSHVSWSIFTG